MLKLRHLLLLAIALGALATLAGCSDEGTDPLATGTTSDDYENLDLSDEFGGLTYDTLEASQVETRDDEINLAANACL